MDAGRAGGDGAGGTGAGGGRLDDLATRLAGIVLPDADGRAVRLGALWAERPVVLAFLRHYG